MNPGRVDILVVEDDPDDVMLLEEMLRRRGTVVRIGQDESESGGNSLESSSGETVFALDPQLDLAHALARLGDCAYEVVLLDTGLPDSQGMETVRSIFERAPDVPIVIYTGQLDEDTAVRGVEYGAQDYLVKGQTDADQLVRSIRFARARTRTLRDLERSRQRELESLSRMLTAEPSVAARMLGMQSLSESAPGTFNELVGRYEKLLDNALGQQVHQTQEEVSGKLRKLAEAIGFLKGGPRDVVLIHTAALKRKREISPTQKVKAYFQEGRFLLLELMGDLASFYRRYAMGASSRTVAATDRPEDSQADKE
jgi:DNA-binding response OmpR family regulator